MWGESLGLGGQHSCGWCAVRPGDLWPSGSSQVSCGSACHAVACPCLSPVSNHLPFSRADARQGHSVFSLFLHVPPEHTRLSGYPPLSWKGHSQEGREWTGLWSRVQEQPAQGD